MPIFIASMNMIKCQNKFLQIPVLRALCAAVMAGLIVILTGCHLNPITDPKPGYLEMTVDYGPPEFRAGYEDGCKMAMRAYGTTMMKTAYAGVHKRPEYQYNDMYNQTWRDAWNYCYMSYFMQTRNDILYGDNFF